MSDIDYEALRGGTPGEPPGGIYDATLQRAALVNTSRGSRLVTDWSAHDDGSFFWTTWFGFEANRLQFTQEFLDAIGVDRSKITDDDALEQALDAAAGERYRVKVEKGANWTNTYVLAPVAQRSLMESDAPADTRGLPEPAEEEDDESIPF